MHRSSKSKYPITDGRDYVSGIATMHTRQSKIRKMGRRIARVIMITSATQRVINSHRGIPQQRWEQPSLSPRPWSESELMVSTLCNVDRLKNVGHDERSRRGGDGKDARGSWRTAELRWRSASSSLPWSFFVAALKQLRRMFAVAFIYFAASEQGSNTTRQGAPTPLQ